MQLLLEESALFGRFQKIGYISKVSCKNCIRFFSVWYTVPAPWLHPCREPPGQRWEENCGKRAGLSSCGQQPVLVVPYLTGCHISFKSFLWLLTPPYINPSDFFPHLFLSNMKFSTQKNHLLKISTWSFYSFSNSLYIFIIPATCKYKIKIFLKILHKEQFKIL